MDEHVAVRAQRPKIGDRINCVVCSVQGQRSEVMNMDYWCARVAEDGGNISA